MTSCQFSRWRISTILDFRGPIMGSLKSPCTTFYRSLIDTIALNCLAFKKVAVLHFGKNIQYGGSPPSWNLKICSFVTWPLSACRSAILLPSAKFHWNQTIDRWVIFKKAIFKMAATATLNFKNFNFLVTWLSPGSISGVVYQISLKSDDFLPRYGDLAIFKMAAVRHLGFAMTSQYYIAGHIFVVHILSWNFMLIDFVVSDIYLQYLAVHSRPSLCTARCAVSRDP